MTCGTVIVEAGERSGALNTAHHAAELGRPLMAVPGPVTSAQSAKCHRIIREWAATCVTCAADIIEMLSPLGMAAPHTASGVVRPGERRPPRPGRPATASTSTAPGSWTLCRPAVALGPSTIAVEAGVDLDTVLRCLGLLSGSGFIERCDRGWRLRKP